MVTSQIRTAKLCRVVRLAERISGSALPSLQDIYLKRCKSRAAKITKDSNHPGSHLFILLPASILFIQYTVYCSAKCICTFYYSLFFILIFTLFFHTYIYVYSLVFVTYNCNVHGADQTYILLLVIFCIIVYVTNTILNLKTITKILFVVCFGHFSNMI